LAAKAVAPSIFSILTVTTSRWMIGQWGKKTVQNVQRLQNVQFVWDGLNDWNSLNLGW
jgi:hypothetical protein